MIPNALETVWLALGVFRLVRLIGWDDFPPVERARAWITGQTIYYNSTEGGESYRYRRPMLAKLIECPWCQGAWVSLGVYWFWVWQPTYTFYVIAPFALSAAVGLVAKNLDP